MKTPLITAAILMTLSGAAAADHPMRGDRVIERLDQNGDGLVSLEEFQPPGERRSRMMIMADTNQDGIVTMDEIMARHAERMAEAEARRQKRQARFAAFIKDLDSDNNGIVTEAEARVATFNRMDEDEDGFISADEFRPDMNGPRRPRDGQRGQKGERRPPWGS